MQIKLISNKNFLAFILFSLIFLLGIFSFKDYGISTDEQFHRENGSFYYNYVKSYNTDIPSIDINDNLFLKMKKIVKEYNLRYENWGWKDPRTCLTVEYWVNIMQELDLSDDIKIIFVVRKALSVSRSLKKRNELPLEQGLELWKAYTERALKFCKESQLPTHYCSFEGLLKDPLSTCDSLFGFLNEQWDPKVVDQFVDSSITSSQKGEEVTPPEDIVRLESELYSRVEK